MSFSRNPIDHGCPVCKAEPGQPCDTRRYWEVLRGFHLSRYPLTKHGGPPGCVAYRACERQGCLGYCKPTVVCGA